MKYYQKIVLIMKYLRTGLAALCLLFLPGMLTGCGSEGELLSELRREEAGFETIDQSGQNEDAENAQDSESDVAALNTAFQAEAEKIYVHVCGAVKHPGVYELPAGSRFYEAVEAAGGFTEDACQDYLNMAASLADGSRLEIPTLSEVESLKEAEKTGSMTDGGKGETEYNFYTISGKGSSAADGESIAAGSSAAGSSSGESGGTAAGNASGGLVNINTADTAVLCSLPGVGEGRAKAIIEYREKQGGFQKKEDIMQVSGIGEKMYARMEAYLTVE